MRGHQSQRDDLPKTLSGNAVQSTPHTTGEEDSQNPLEGHGNKTIRIIIYNY